MYKVTISSVHDGYDYAYYKYRYENVFYYSVSFMIV